MAEDETVPSTTQRTLLIQRERGNDVRVTLPENTIITFGPWSPPTSKTVAYNERALAGTLRVYRGPKSRGDVIFVLSGVTGYRDISTVDFEEKVTTQEVQTIWKSDRHGYKSETQGNVSHEWVREDTPALTAGSPDVVEGEAEEF